jgi:hypothetical protein
MTMGDQHVAQTRVVGVELLGKRRQVPVVTDPGVDKNAVAVLD